MMLHRRFLGILVGLTAVVAAFGQGAFCLLYTSDAADEL